jgi:hypothetical protein
VGSTDIRWRFDGGAIARDYRARPDQGRT